MYSRLSFQTLAAGLLLAGCVTGSPEDLPPDNADARVGQLLRVADSTAQAGDYAAAADLYGRASRIAPEDPAPLLGLAWSRRQTGDLAGSEEAYRAALALRPESVDGLSGLGLTLILADRPAEAADMLEKAVEQAPDRLEFLTALGTARSLSGDFAAAKQTFETGLSEEPGNFPLNVNHALNLALAGEGEAAVSRLTPLLSEPGSEGLRARNSLALVHAISGNLEAARDTLSGYLSEAALARNIAFYEALQELSPRAKARAALTGRID
jgi:Flp pilus assembly protein TadD